MITKRGISEDCFFEKRLVSEYGKILFGSMLARKRPKPRAYPTREDYVDDAQLKVKFELGINVLGC